VQIPNCRVRDPADFPNRIPPALAKTLELLRFRVLARRLLFISGDNANRSFLHMSTALTAENRDQLSAAAHDERDVPLPLRGDNFLGVCEAIGQDLGFNANWLRVPFAALLLWNPVAIVGSYFALGAVVAVSRWLFPVAKPVPAGARAPQDGTQAHADAENLDSDDLLAA